MKSIVLKLINEMRQKPWLLFVCSFLYNLNNVFHLCTIAAFFDKRVVCKGSFLHDVKIHITGKDSHIYIGPKVMMRHCNIYVKADNASIHIEGGGTNLANATLSIHHKGGSILLSQGFTIMGGDISSVQGGSVSVGKDCMFSSKISLMSGDFHPIIDTKSGACINMPKDIVIGDHVWLAASVKVLKGSHIANHTVVGNSAIVSGELSESNAIYVGSPAKLIRRGIDWERDSMKYIN